MCWDKVLLHPRLEELFSMFKILEVYESGAYDTIIVDRESACSYYTGENRD
ncbi:MAG: ArsA family ATPase [Lachnospiraceae bacterium]|nr:ArsA family ATPase [Lachnospiraceae bacterium]